MIGPQQWKFAGAQVAVAVVVALGARLVQSSIKPLSDESSAFGILFDPTLWSNFATFVFAYLTIAAAIGWIVGVGVALVVIAGVAAARQQWLVVMLAIPSVGAALSMIGALFLA